jgi:hypothetical protein
MPLSNIIQYVSNARKYITRQKELKGIRIYQAKMAAYGTMTGIYPQYASATIPSS